jgi:hypothetical protein
MENRSKKRCRCRFRECLPYRYEYKRASEAEEEGSRERSFEGEHAGGRALSSREDQLLGPETRKLRNLSGFARVRSTELLMARSPTPIRFNASTTMSICCVLCGLQRWVLPLILPRLEIGAGGSVLRDVVRHLLHQFGSAVWAPPMTLHGAAILKGRIGRR